MVNLKDFFCNTILLLMVQKSGDHQLNMVNIPLFTGFHTCGSCGVWLAGFPPPTIVHLFGLLSYNDPCQYSPPPNDEATDVGKWIEKLQVMDTWR